MTSRRFITSFVFVLAAGCGVLPPPPDAGLMNVPLSYRLAKAAPGHQTHLTIKGEKQVYCRDCHAVTDAGFHAPPADLCASCHKDQVKQHHPLDAGVDLSCLTCHPFMAKTLPTRFEKWMCFDCHQKPQGEKDRIPAIAVHKSECQECHRPHQQPFTLAAECTQCHDVTLKHGAKGDTLAEKCMNCHEHHTEAVKASGMCVTCHMKPEMTAKARVAQGALFDKGHTGCGSCHTAHTFDHNVVKPCTSCHQNQRVVGAKDHDACIDCHKPHQPRAAPVDCKSCHNKEVVKHPKSKEGQTCIGCHPVHEKAMGEKLAVACTNCHTKAPFDAKVIHAEKVQCADCHEPHEAKPTSLRECKSCHDTRFVEVARIKDPKGHRECKGCHENLPHGLAGQKPCLSCHEKRKPPQAGHTDCKSCHESHSGAVIKTCKQCHEVAKLPGLHQEKEHQQCEKCHTPHTPDPGRGPATCKSCHKALKLEQHPTPPTQCSGCHLFLDAKPGRDGGQ
ncbi:MAG: hypothetical protein GQE15_31905 [Archangiaceae bacterium]|nr:hypothetical protein [Archangiaceae bacterium]